MLLVVGWTGGPIVRLSILLTGMLFLGACGDPEPRDFAELATLAPGWSGEIVARVDQSYAGWDVEIGDADNDGRQEILYTGCPDSRLYLTELQAGQWQTRLLADNLGQSHPSMGLTVRVVDLDRDASNELLVGTGQETGGAAYLHVLRLDGSGVLHRIRQRPGLANSSYTHNLATADVDGDGLQEIFSAYCPSGEIARYDLDPTGEGLRSRTVHQLSGSGEETLFADVDNDGEGEILTSNGFRPGQARVEIHEFDAAGELVHPPRWTLEGFDGRACFYASLIVGDVDNDGANELIVGWKEHQTVNRGTLLAYAVDDDEVVVEHRFAEDDPDLDLSYFEKMMCVADLDNDGRNELVVSTRGDGESEGIESRKLGHILLYEVDEGRVERTLLVDLDGRFAGSSWIAVGDCDDDGSNELVLATGKGDRRKPGNSYVAVVRRSQDDAATTTGAPRGPR